MFLSRKPLLQWLFLAIWSFLGMSCSVISPLSHTKPAIPASYKNITASKMASSFKSKDYFSNDERWWLAFNDPSLNRLIEMAFLDNLDLRSAIYRLIEAEAQVKKANSTLWPFLDLELQGQRQGNGNIASGKYSYSLAASYELDIFGRLRALRQEKMLEKKASKEDAKGLMLSLSANIANVYYKIAEYKEKLNAQRQIVEDLEKTFLLVQFRYESGLVSSLDLYQARQSLIANKVLIPEMESVLEANINSLMVLLGKSPQSTLPDELKDPVLPKNVPPIPQRLPSTLLNDRPDIRAAYLRLCAQDKRVAQALSAMYPRFDLTAFFTGSNGQLRNLMDYKNSFWQVFAGVVQPIFHGGALKAEMKGQLAVAKRLASDYHATILKAFKEVEDTLYQLGASHRQLLLVEERLRTLKASERLALWRYRAGLSDFLPVLQAQSALHGVIQEKITKKYQLISTYIQLARVLGGKWMDKKLDQVTKKLNGHDD